MDRYAVFVDAGYLWAAGIEAAFGEREDFGSLNRANVAMDYSGMVATVKRFAATFAPGRELLRVYWYDAAPDRIPTREHQRIAQIPETKLRLGHLTANGVQKNVDAMLLLDLTALARQNSVQTAVILGGDGDFVEGVTTAQAFGVKVFLIGIDGPGESMSPELKMEADNYGLLGKNDLARFFSIQSDGQVRPRWSKLEILGPADQVLLGRAGQEEERTPQLEDAYLAGRRFALRMKLTSSMSELEAALQSKPVVPESIHYRLLRYTIESFEKPWGSTRLSGELSQRMRDGFWDGLEEVARGSGG
ncbi:MAG: NYN domain-containing protein [Actinomycetota bacterium]|nr:NYN domain-containing protein [Actinomycetota bacterium]